MINLNQCSNFKEESTPYIIREGLFGATFKKNNESLFLRMELLTPENTASWNEFKLRTLRIANKDVGGVLGAFVRGAGTPDQVCYEKVKERTGFTNEEHLLFIEKAIILKNKTNNKIIDIINSNSVGSHAMYTTYESEKLNYIVYVSKNRDFSISNLDINGKKTLKNFIDSYQDILISMGSDFSEKKSLINRGISRNPYWVFEEKYAGLSMMLHAFTGAVAERFFPDKEEMEVSPVGSMQCIMKKNLLADDGYIIIDGKRIDITVLQCSANGPELPNNYHHIKISALTRIYYQYHL
jgi:hypothetical protein